MKKITALLAAAAICGACLFSATACNDSNGKYSVYAPDGAPALSLVNAISQNDKDFEYRVIDSSLIQTKVTGERPQADFCILPVNMASNLLGSGETYQMLGTVTNGNLYFMSTSGESITTENIQTVLIGKTVGCIQLKNVPGLTLQAVLADYNVPYQTIESIQATKSETKVNLLAMEAGNMTPAFGCDYYLCPEPALSTKIKNTTFDLAGDLQKLYGEGNGYPQAVLVAKKSIIANDKAAVEKFVSSMKDSAAYLATVAPQTVLNLLDKVRTDGLKPSFDANNLSATVIQNCSVRYTPASEAKTDVKSFLQKLIAINANAASTVSDDFFYTETL